MRWSLKIKFHKIKSIIYKKFHKVDSRFCTRYSGKFLKNSQDRERPSGPKKVRLVIQVRLVQVKLEKNPEMMTP